MKATWVKYKSHGGPRYKGAMAYHPEPPFDEWECILGVVARCEGNHDTVVMYDATGVTWGFMQWTFKSGRLQKLLESFKAIPVYDFTTEHPHDNLFELACCDENGNQLFQDFGFEIRGGKFFDLKLGRALNPSKANDRTRINNVCMGRTLYTTFARQKEHALGLAELFGIGVSDAFGIEAAQSQFAISEFKRQMQYNRPPLGGHSIAWLLNSADPACWATPLAALFFNLWQNNPGAAYKLFKQARKVAGAGDAEAYFEQAWKMANRSKFGNWGWKPGNKSPRVVRIKKAIKEFYGRDLKYYK